MVEFLEAVSPVFYVFLIVSSVLFGISLAINVWLVSVIKKVRKTTDKTFNSSMTDVEIERVKSAINTAKLDYFVYVERSRKIKKTNRNNKVKKVFYLKEKPINIAKKDIKSIFLDLIKNVYEPFSVVNGKKRSYLSFSKNEIFTILNTLIKRIDCIASTPEISFIKNIKLSFISECFYFYGVADKFFNKIWVIITFRLINFFMWFGRVFSPVSLSKYFVKHLSSEGLSYLIYDTMISVVGKELAIIYKNGRTNSENLLK